MELNGFMIGPEIKTLFKIKVGAVIVEHPVSSATETVNCLRVNFKREFLGSKNSPASSPIRSPIIKISSVLNNPYCVCSVLRPIFSALSKLGPSTDYRDMSFLSDFFCLSSLLLPLRQIIFLGPCPMGL